MARIGLRREHIKSIIVTQDREFKHKAITFLNGSAFAAEKICVQQMQNALDSLVADGDCLNFIYDATAVKTEDLTQSLTAFARTKATAEVRLMIFLTESQTAEKAIVQKLTPQANLWHLPMAQAQFNKSLSYSKNIALKGKESEAKAATPTPASQDKDSNKAAPSLSLVEASAHLKETVDLLNAVAKDKKRVDAVRLIGQKFNGLIGAFAFFTQGGYPKMRELAKIVDDIARTYSEDQNLVITDKHWELLSESAKTLYFILKDMRENRPVTASYIAKADALLSEYAETSDISRRQSQSQDEIDQLLDAELFRKSS